MKQQGSKQQQVRDAVDTMHDALLEASVLRDVLNGVRGQYGDDDEETQVAVLESVIDERLNTVHAGLSFIYGLTQSKPAKRKKSKKSKKSKIAVAKAA